MEVEARALKTYNRYLSPRQRTDKKRKGVVLEKSPKGIQYRIVSDLSKVEAIPPLHYVVQRRDDLHKGMWRSRCLQFYASLHMQGDRITIQPFTYPVADLALACLLLIRAGWMDQMWSAFPKGFLHDD